MERKPFQTFEDLEVYKAACGFRVTMYAVSRDVCGFAATSEFREV